MGDNSPELYGWPLVAAANALETLPFVAQKIAADGGLMKLREYNDINELPTTLAIPEDYILNMDASASIQAEKLALASDTRSRSQTHLSFWDYHEAYLEKKTTPKEVAEKLIQALHEHSGYHWMRAFDKEAILRQAEESTARYEKQQPLSQLDGVFIPVKEELDVEGFETRFGTSFINKGKSAKKNATLVQRLRDAGAIILGHAVMNELGWDTFTINPVTGVPANPYHEASSCGGSSGGSAGMVAANLAPVAIGCDGGGSIRIPAAFCGLYGLKTTTGRVSSTGGMPVDPTLSVSGPLAATADDMALTYAIMAGVDTSEPRTRYQPAVSLQDYTLTHTLEGVTIATCAEWNNCVAEPAVLERMNDFVAYFKSLGAKVIEIEIPDLQIVNIAHSITICSEMYNFASRFPEHRREFCAHTRIMSAVSQCLDARDYVRAQQVRTRYMDILLNLFDAQHVDLILSPATAIVAPEIPRKAHAYGMNHTRLTVQAMRYTQFANLTGIPACSIPAGIHNGKPVGIQLMAKWWNEALLCRMAKVCELAPDVERTKPALCFSGLV
ncbi:amidase signature domain-containing protein [Gongronella butleri]|nr:amidase signature domain-containing protein [Gongronella butleri]